MKAVWTGEWPFKSACNENNLSLQNGEEGFVIYPSTGPLHVASEKEYTVSARPCSDRLLEKNARATYQENCYVEPVYDGGILTGEFRARRQGLNGWYEMAKFLNRHEALAWVKGIAGSRDNN